jgi:hypothetical protein
LVANNSFFSLILYTLFGWQQSCILARGWKFNLFGYIWPSVLVTILTSDDLTHALLWTNMQHIEQTCSSKLTSFTSKNRSHPGRTHQYPTLRSSYAECNM